MTERKRRSFRCSDEEWEAIKKQAKAEGRTPSNLIWWAVMRYIGVDPNVETISGESGKSCKVSTNLQQG